MTREAVKNAINAHDPMLIIFLDAKDMSVLNDDEYDFEVDLICRCVAKCGGSCSVERLAEIVRTVFAETFGGEDFTTLAKTFEQIAEEILRDTSTGGIDVAEVKPFADDATDDYKDLYVAAEEKIFARLFDTATPAISDTTLEDSQRDAERAIMESIFAEKTRQIQRECLEILETTYRGAIPQLKFGSPFELLVAVILSAQCTDKRVNQITQILFPLANTPEKILRLGQVRLEEIIRPCGLSRSKAKHITETAQILIDKYGGEVPSEFDELIKLPGVGRKTANVVTSVAFKNPAIAVDTHVFRVANRTKLAEGKTPLEVERGLQEVIPREKWSDAHHWLIWHGRGICKARNPKCDVCPLSKVCPSST